MINLTGKGSRLAVMKLTDAEDDKNIGRIQARREDDVSEYNAGIFKQLNIF